MDRYDHAKLQQDPKKALVQTYQYKIEKLVTFF